MPSLLQALTSTFPLYAHPIASSPIASSSTKRLSPYAPLPPASHLLTDSQFVASLPRPKSGVIHILGNSALPTTDDVVLISRSAQEAYDHALLAEKLTREKGGTVRHLLPSDVLETEVLEVADWLDQSTPALSGSAEEGQDQPWETVEKLQLSLLKASRRAQRPFSSPATTPQPNSPLLLNFLTSPIAVSGPKLDILLGSPLPAPKLVHAAKPFNGVVVLESASSSAKFGSAWSAVVSSLETLDIPIRSILASSAPSSEEVQAAIDSDAPISRIGSVTEQTVSADSIVIPAPETSYTNLLETSPSPLEILNHPSSLKANESTSPLYAFGKAVAIRQSRDRLVELAKAVLRATDTKPEVHAALSDWLLVRDQTGSASTDAGKKVEAALSSAKSTEETELLNLGRQGYWTKKNLWIIVSNSWATDLSSSGLHHVLASGLDINLLVYETAPSPYSPGSRAQAPEDRKKDLALYALQMGDVYVSSVAVYADYSNVINAMREAEAYSGAGLVMAYLPWGEVEDGGKLALGGQVGPLERLKETKKAVAGGWWPLFRFDPSKPESKQMALDSPIIKERLRELLDRQNHFSQLTLAQPAISETVTSSEGGKMRTARDNKARKAFEALLGGLEGGAKVLVLYASDGGTAEKVAKQFVQRAKVRGVQAELAVADSKAEELKTVFGIDENKVHGEGEAEPERTDVIFITSVAGQGEFPQNGRQFWKAAQTLPALSSDGDSSAESSAPTTPRLAIFGLGDSHYWPRPEDAGYYNKPAKDLAQLLYKKLGVKTLFEDGEGDVPGLGLGDDQDPDGWKTGYKGWEDGVWRGLGVDDIEVDEKEAVPEPVANEHIKIASDYLRGTILEGLADKTTGAIGASDAQLTKFHGTYMQDDRDIRQSLTEQGLEPAYSFMIRVRLPGGVATPAQWLAMDRIGDEYANSTMKMTTRQTFQFHGVLKRHLKLAMQAINKGLLDTIAACGDVNRNVLCTVNPHLSPVHAEAYRFAAGISSHLLPKTTAYHEIWLDQRKVFGGEVPDLETQPASHATDASNPKGPDFAGHQKKARTNAEGNDFEPMYGPTYLPRKFKIAVAVPPDNAVDVFTNDVGFIAIVEGGKIIGYNVTVGGGMGMTHNNKKTYPRLGSLLGFVTPEQGNKVAEGIMLVQRDEGNRKDRKNARLKYTIDRLTLPVFKSMVEQRTGWPLQPVRPFTFNSNIDEYGWTQAKDGSWHYTLFIENGRVEDTPTKPYKTGLREIAKVLKGEFRLTANQHVVLACIQPEDKAEIEGLMRKYKLDQLDRGEVSDLRKNASACVAFPTCGLAMAESERYLPIFITKLEKIFEEAGVTNRDVPVIRMSGCGNSCSRPHSAEIALVGKAPGQYMVSMGGGRYGQRLNKPWMSNANEPEILAALKPLIKRWAIERNDNEPFGDWTIRAGVVKETTEGRRYWEGSAEDV